MFNQLHKFARELPISFKLWIIYDIFVGFYTLILFYEWIAFFIGGLPPEAINPQVEKGTVEIILALTVTLPIAAGCERKVSVLNE